MPIERDEEKSEWKRSDPTHFPCADLVNDENDNDGDIR